MNLSKRCLSAVLGLCLGVGALQAAMPFSIEPKLPRKIEIGKEPCLTLKPGNFEIVTPVKPVPAVALAAKELSTLLSQRFGGATVPVVTKPTGNLIEIRLGDPEFAKTMGVDVAELDRDGFVMRTRDKTILIIGRDSTDNPLRSAYRVGNRGEWATLFGAEDFLERFAGVRYYYPGKLGTVVPESDSLDVPVLNIYDRPDFLERRFNDYNHGRRPIRRYPEWDGYLNLLHNRAATVQIPNCHGLSMLDYDRRFGKTHPEYFALNHTGNRMIDTSGGKKPFQSFLCASSGIRDEIVKDGISYLNGDSSQVRDIKNGQGKYQWTYLFPPNTPFFNIMPHDGLYLCRCDKCQEHYSKGPQATSDYLWSFFNDITERIVKEKPDCFVTTMAYGEYKLIPTQPIAKNLLVMLALRGPWNEYQPEVQAADMELLKAWKEKMGQKLWLWTYPGKYGGNMPGIPHTTPRALKSFIKRAQPYIFGLYIECESDVILFNYLTYHVFGKVAWNPDVDVEKLLDEHASFLYGPAAKPMKNFFDSIEKHWEEIASNVVETSLGPKTIYPSELTLWGKIYSPDEISRLDGLFDEAEKLAAANETYLARVKFARTEILDSIKAQANVFHQANDAVKAWCFHVPQKQADIVIDGHLNDEEWKNASDFSLHGLCETPTEVQTSVKVTYDKDFFYFGVNCAEPMTDKIVANERKFDDKDVWTDSDVELFISPDCDREHFYQLLFNAKGFSADLEVLKNVEIFSWNSNADIKTQILPGKGWTAEVRLPRASMRPCDPKGVLVEFSRHRVLDDLKVKTEYYNWSPFARQFGDVSRFGMLSFEPDDRVNLIDFPDFELPVTNKRWIGKRWFGEGILERDQEYFVTKNGALRLRFPDGPTVAKQYFRELKPNTTYQINFFAKMDKVKKMEARWSGFYLRFDPCDGTATYFPTAPVQFDGTCPWTRFTFQVKTGDQVGSNKKRPYIGINLRKAEGTVWIDHVQMFEVK